MSVICELIAAEDAAAQADVEKDLAFLRSASEGDGPAVLALIEKTFDGGEDPRLVAGIKALKRTFSKGAAKC